MIKVSNVAVVTGPPQDVSRFLRLATKEIAWRFAADWDKPSPPTADHHGDELSPGETQVSMDISTDRYPATHSLIAASRECPEVAIYTEFMVDGPVCIYGSADVRAGRVGFWDYVRGGRDLAGFQGEDCPVPWWEQSAEAMDAWVSLVDEVSDADESSDV